MPCARGSSAFEHYGQEYLILETIKIAFLKEKKKQITAMTQLTLEPAVSVLLLL